MTKYDQGITEVVMSTIYHAVPCRHTHMLSGLQDLVCYKGQAAAPGFANSGGF